MTYRSLLGMVALVALSGGWADAQSEERPTAEQVMSEWSRERPPLRVEWHHKIDHGIGRFCRYVHPIGTSSGIISPSNRLQVDKDQFLAFGLRLVNGEHGYHLDEVGGVTVTLSEFFPERSKNAFERALDNRFEKPDEPVMVAQSFVRTFNGSQLRDYWEPEQGRYPRATLHRLPEANSSEWSLLSLNEPDGQLDTLDTFAALMALRPGHSYFGEHMDGWEVSRQPDVVMDAPCWRITVSNATAMENSRTYWVDPAIGLLVRRYRGTSTDQILQIDINYQQTDDFGWAPLSWSVALRSADQAPIQQFIRSKVNAVESAQPLTEEAHSFSYPVGTWVVHEPADEQYLIEADGQRRMIQPREFRWLPTYEELRATESGKVGNLIERKVQQRQLWNQAKWPVVVGGAALIGAVMLRLLRRKRVQRSSLASESLPT